MYWLSLVCKYIFIDTSTCRFIVGLFLNSGVFYISECVSISTSTQVMQERGRSLLSMHVMSCSEFSHSGLLSIRRQVFVIVTPLCFHQMHSFELRVWRKIPNITEFERGSITALPKEIAQLWLWLLLRHNCASEECDAVMVQLSFWL